MLDKDYQHEDAVVAYSSFLNINENLLGGVRNVRMAFATAGAFSIVVRKQCSAWID